MANEFVVRRGVVSLGGITFPQVTIYSAYTITEDDYLIDCYSGSFEVTLPTAIGKKGRLYTVKNNGFGQIIVKPIVPGQKIDLLDQVILNGGDSIQLGCDGTDYLLIAEHVNTANNSTGVVSFTGLTIVSPTTFYVSPVNGWIGWLICRCMRLHHS